MHITAAEQSAMTDAFDLALRGPRGINPQVGAVILSSEGKVLATGWHRGAGTPHAEIDALSRVAARDARGATAVVTLEPCSHTGRTAPCAAALIDAGIARVVYAQSDPGIDSGGGAELLRAAGIDIVRTDSEEGRALISDWLFVQQHGRPRVTVKWAQSLDARGAASDGTSQWITGKAARAHVHEQRAQHGAIAVGTGTIVADDPLLTARPPGVDIRDGEQPIPVVFGTRDVPATARVRQHPRELLTFAGPIAPALQDLASRGVQRLYVEGGPRLASAFVRQGLADVIHAYIAPTLIGGPFTSTGDLGVATIDEQHRLSVDELTRLGDDILIIASPTDRKDT